MAGAQIAALAGPRAGRLGFGSTLPTLGAGSAVAGLGLANGGYFPSEWGWAALAFALGALLATLARARPSFGPLEWVGLGALSAFATWTLLSVLWSPSSMQPVLAFERTAVYVLALAAVFAVATSSRSAVSLVTGVLGGIVVLCGDGLLMRVDGTATTPRLAEPVGYENAVGILATIGLLVALGLAANAAVARLRLLAFATVPLLSATLYLTYSRGAWLALAVGACIAFAVETRRGRLLGVFVLALPTAILADLSAAKAQRGVWLGAALVACTALAPAIGAVAPRLAGPRHVRRAAAIAVFVLLAVAWPVVSHDPGGRLLSASSNGRGDYWSVAWREVEAHRLLGGGAGSYVSYWNRWRSSDFPAQNAHNLYLETLAELGPPGLVLLVVALGLPLLAARRVRGHPAVTAASAGFGAFAVHSAVDWDFQLVAVTVAGLILGGAVLVAARRELRSPPLPLGRGSKVVALAAAAVLAIAVQVGNSATAGSRAALDRDDAATAARLALRAHRWQPWSFEPWQLLGEAQLASGRLDPARVSFRRALSLDRSNAALWADLAEASSGIERADALARAHALDPNGG
jgi:hypothetical protein